MEIPGAVREAIEAHGPKVVAGDTGRLMADFEPDRVGQLLGAVSIPAGGVRSCELDSLELTEPGVVTATIRYTAADASTFVLRSRWRSSRGVWRIFEVRNLPERPPRFGTEGPAADGLDEPFWTGLVAGELRLQRCADCREWIWGPSPLCPACHGFDPGWEAVRPAGRLYSWTRVHQPFAPEAAGHLPYVVALVELPHAGHRRVLGVLTPADGREPAIGGAVRGEIEHSDQGWPLLRWRPVDTSAVQEMLR